MVQVENGCWLTQIYPKPFPGVLRNNEYGGHSSLLHYRYESNHILREFSFVIWIFYFHQNNSQKFIKRSFTFRQNSTSSSTFSLLPSTSGSSSSLLSPPDWCNQIPIKSSSSSQASPTFVTVTGCPLLKRMSLQGCSSVTDKAIWCLLLHKPGLQVLRYHQAYSVAEILCRECSIFKKYPFIISDESESDNEQEMEDDYSPLEKRPKQFDNEVFNGPRTNDTRGNLDNL